MVAIDSAVPRREEGTRTDDDLSASSMVSLSRGLPSVPSIHSMQSPSRLPAYGTTGKSHASAAFQDSHESPTLSLEVQPCMHPRNSTQLSPVRSVLVPPFAKPMYMCGSDLLRSDTVYQALSTCAETLSSSA